MRSDETTQAKRDDISADELLKLLHKSVEKTDAPAEKPRTSSAAKKRPDSMLAIDDAVYTSAEKELKDTNGTSDDSDLDIDALIEKYISKPPKAEPAPIPEEEEELLPEAEAEDTAEEEAAAAEEAAGEIAGEDDLLPDEEPQIDEIVREFTSPRRMQTDAGSRPEPEALIPQSSDPEEPEEADEDDDVKVFGEEPITHQPPVIIEEEPEPEPEAEPEPPAPAADAKTEVFDISRVKELAAADTADVDAALDEAFENSATEVFTPVHVDDEQPTQTYGKAVEEEIDQTDLNLMIAFGMNEELKETVGEEKATELEDDIQKRHEETSQMQAVDGHIEFTSRDQTNEILTNYKNQYYTLILRIILSIVLVGAVFLVENYSMLGLTLPKFMRPTSYPVVYAMIDLQLIVLGAALVFRQVVDGVKNLVQLRPVPESVTAFLLGLAALYTAVACLSAPVDGFRLYNLPVAATVTLALIYEFMNLKRDVFSFNVVSSKKKKFVVSPVSDSTESLEREMFRDYIPEDSQIIRVTRTDFVDGFFARVGDARISRPIIGIIIPVVMIVAAAFVIFTFIKTQSVYSAFTNAFMAVTITMPISAFLIYSLPFYKASKDAYENDSAIIGETSLEEYAGSAVISFEDKEVFPSSGVKVTSIKVYGNNRIDEIIYSLASAFIKVGGPLAEVFSQATHDLGHSDDVELLEVEEDGYTVTIDDVEVHIGKASYMEKKDFEPPFDIEDKRVEQSSSIGILYVAYGGQLAAKVYVQYTIDGEFEGILSQLYKTGMCVGIKSFDPNIDDLLLAKKIKAMKYPVKVIRSKTVEDIPHISERTESGIVSKRSVKALLKTVALCERVSSVIKVGVIFKIMAMAIGLLGMIFIFVFGSELEIFSLWILLWQLLSLVPIIAATFLSIRK
ncbi:MAG: hypothetical protein J6C52_10935 [Clostridia bacterium]|nr:hypothetical protein [Clostridia bacterium]